MYTAFINEKGIGEFEVILPAMFGKSSMLWPALLYVLSNKSIRERITGQRFNAKKYKNALVKSACMKNANNTSNSKKNKINKNSTAHLDQSKQLLKKFELCIQIKTYFYNDFFFFIKLETKKRRPRHEIRIVHKNDVLLIFEKT
jgi:hypothetical protein